MILFIKDIFDNVLDLYWVKKYIALSHQGEIELKNDVDSFQKYREEMNQKILDSGNLDLKRFFSLDHSVYQKGALDQKTKELMGLVASTVLRCNDCILYHLIRCVEMNVTNDEFSEAMAVALVVGGSITIPHLRYAFEMLETIRLEKA
jgi:AhpD family alkylhydroperoxidase